MEERRILIIEDEPKIADTLKLGLTENDYQVDVAYDGIVGYEMFLSHQYSILVLDIHLPGINGYELCKLVRTKNVEIPVIMLTALSTLEDKIVGYDAGADDYIVKPFPFKELLMKIRVLLKRSTGTKVAIDNTLRAGDLKMDVDSKEVTRAGNPVHLTAKEFQLLEYLLHHKNKVVSRAEIAVNVWDIDFDTNTNVIDVYISYLRNKVDKPFEQKLIQTHVGLGYILKAD